MKNAAFFACIALTACAADPPSPAEFDAGVKAYDAGDYAKAYAIFRDMANDDLAAMRNVALMLRKGEGVAKDPESARKWMLRAAIAGLPTAQADLGEMLLNGEGGPPDLGEMLLNGEGGPPDPAAALPWLQLAATASHPIAQFQLGEIYEAGQVVPQDFKLAKQYYAAAASHGVTAARDRLAALNGMPEPQPPTTTLSSAGAGH